MVKDIQDAPATDLECEKPDGRLVSFATETCNRDHRVFMRVHHLPRSQGHKI